jgi:hypothetical protein
MEIPLSIFYYLYLICILLFFIWSLFNVYHLLRFGFLSLVNIGIILVYIAVSAAFIMLSLEYLAEFDWSATFITFSNSPSNFGL